jgi:hypothetical protein
MDLPKREKTFYFDYEGESGFRYEGTFTVKCRLTVAEKYASELEKTRLQGDTSNPSAGLSGLAIALSSLRSRIIDGPNWWKQGLGLGIEDEDALVELFNKVEDTANEWVLEVKKLTKDEKLGN